MDSTTSEQTPVSVAVTGIESMRWSVRLLTKSPLRLGLILVAAVIAGLLGLAFFHQALMGLLGFAMILGSTADYWLGSSFAVTDRRAEARTGASLTALDWENLKRVAIGQNSLRLSPLASVGKMEPFRGVLLRTNNENHLKVIDFVRRHAPEGTVFEDSRTGEG